MTRPNEARQPPWNAILDAAAAKALGEVHTVLPCIVRSYDVATQTVECESVVEPRENPYPIFSGVPVMWPGGAAGFLHVPLAANDTVLLLFSQEDFSKWWDTGSVSAPAVLARHGLYSIAIPGLRRAKAPLAVTGGHVTLGVANELRLGADAATAFVALANLVDARFETIRTTWFVPTGVGPSGTPAAAGVPALASVAATKVKAI